MPFKPPSGRKRPFLLAFVTPPLLLCASCAGTQPQTLTLTIPVAQSLREPCPRPAAEFATIGDLAAFAVREEAALSICDARRGAAVAVIDAHNATVAQLKRQLEPKPWWRFWRSDSSVNETGKP